MHRNRFKVTIEGCVHFLENIDEVIDHIETSVYFEVDSQALMTELKQVDKNDRIVLRDDCIIERIA